MLKRRVKIEESPPEERENRGKILQIKMPQKPTRDKLIVSEREKGGEEVYKSDLNYAEWIERNLLKSLENIKDYGFLKVYSQNELGESLSSEEFINNLLKAFFRREDLEIFKENLRTLIERLERTERLEVKNMKLLNENKSYRELLNRSVEKEKILEIVLPNSYFYDYKNYREIIELLREEAKERSSGEFIIAFTSSLKEITTVGKLIHSLNEDKRLEIIYVLSSKLLKSLSNRYVTNRKRLLSLFAEYLSGMFESYNFISGEDFTFVDSKVHNIVVKEGQRVKESLTFCVVKRETSQTLKYADVVTF